MGCFTSGSEVYYIHMSLHHLVVMTQLSGIPIGWVLTPSGCACNRIAELLCNNKYIKNGKAGNPQL